MKGLSSVEKKLLDEFLKKGKELSAFLEKLEAKDLLRFLRKRLFLTQEALAKKAGVPRSTIMRIERGEVEPTIGMLKKIFNVMECDLLFLPLPRVLPDDLLKMQAQKIASKRIKYLMGTMALEKQQPQKKWEQHFLEQEIEDLLKSGADIWKEDGK